jgi:hypothetical protein
MSDIRELLDRTARWAEARPSTEMVEADVLRGRAAKERRRRARAIRFSIAGMVAAAALVGTTVVAGDMGASGPDRGTPIRLVAYHGDQLEGFIVEHVPEGWYLQGSNEFRLTIAPRGDMTSPDAFEGKLVIMLLSASAPQELPKGDPVKVGEHDGVVSHTDPEADILTYVDDGGHLVQIQAWRQALGWTNEQLARFAEGVQATAYAQAGVG